MVPSLLLWILAVLLVAVGLAGVVLPALPGAMLIFAGLVLAAWADDFAFVGAGTLAVIAGLALLTYLMDVVAGAFGARRFGAGRRAVVGAALGAGVGLFFGLLGVLLGPFLGAFLGELSVHGRVSQAGKAGLGAWLGLSLGMAGKLSLSFAMLGLFVAARFL